MSTWIPISERLPTVDDADEHGHVVCRAADGATWCEHYERKNVPYSTRAIAWMPLPRYSPPAPPEPVIRRVWADWGNFDPTSGRCYALPYQFNKGIEFVEVATLVAAVRALGNGAYYTLAPLADVVKLIEGEK